MNITPKHMVLAALATIPFHMVPAHADGEKIAVMTKNLTNPFPISDEVLLEGERIYQSKGTCFTCHGASGRGDGPAGLELNPRPRNFTTPRFHDSLINRAPLHAGDAKRDRDHHTRTEDTHRSAHTLQQILQ